MDINLLEEVYEGVTYRQVRDAFKTIAFDSFDLIEFSCRLFIKEQKKELELSGDNLKVNELFYWMREFLSGKKSRVSDCVSFNRYFESAKQVINLLENQSLVEPVENGFKLSKSGHSLRMQKAIKRISITKAENILDKMISKIENYNLSVNDYYVDAIYLYGSVVEHKETVGDIDIAFSYSRHYINGESDENWLNRMYEKYDTTGYIFATKTMKSMISSVKKMIRVSSYISLSHDIDLVEMISKGDANSKVLWKRKSIELEDLNIPNLSMYASTEESTK